ncbi:MAG TPA: SdiA-regulated domain-containing protein, partial [Flavisolibacter sp.]|nr:SdiA-regulated domain-containing protein [Flavisolibacter sp.]
MIKELIQTKCPILVWSALVCALTLHSGCKGQGYGNPEGYDLGKPQEMQLGKVLNEISGLDYNEDDSTLLAISDSKEKIFQIGLKTKKLKDLTGKVVPPDSDLEDLVKIGDTVYLLSSWGEIKVVPMGAKDTSGIKTYDLGLQGQNDFETLYYDPTARGLVMVCKSCAHEKGKGVRTAFRFDLKTRTFDSTAFFTISRPAVEDLLKDKDAKFDPAAAAINPHDKRLYILSSSGNLLIVADTRGKVIEAFKLNPDKFPQAEGIA